MPASTGLNAVAATRIRTSSGPGTGTSTSSSRSTSASLDPQQLGAYFALMEVSSLLRHTVEQHLRAEGDLSYVQFQILARLEDSPSGGHRMTDLADSVVYSRSG